MIVIYCLASFALGAILALAAINIFLCNHEYEIVDVYKIVHTWEDEPSYTEWIYVQKCKHCGKLKVKKVKG